jgi:hypothetical protein
MGSGAFRKGPTSRARRSVGRKWRYREPLTAGIACPRTPVPRGRTSRYRPPRGSEPRTRMEHRSSAAIATPVGSAGRPRTSRSTTSFWSRSAAPTTPATSGRFAGTVTGTCTGSHRRRPRERQQPPARLGMSGVSQHEFELPRVHQGPRISGRRCIGGFAHTHLTQRGPVK